MNPANQVQRHLNLAYRYYEESEAFDKALEECERAIQLDSLLSDAHNLRGIILEELGRPWDAVEAYKKALKLDPDFSEAKENLDALKAELAAQSRVVTLAMFSYPAEAYILKSKLEAEGIWAFVANVETSIVYGSGIGGIKLQVKEKDAEKAREILGL